LALRESGEIVFHGGAVGRMVKGDDPLSPRVEASASELLDPPQKEKVRRRLAAWLDAHLRSHLRPLFDLRDAPLSGAARGLAFTLAQSLGTMRRRRIAQQVAALKPAERRALSRLGVVIGREARQVPIERAADYIFGYTLENDVSDRGGRGDSRHGSDWLVGKSHDTFAPLGPFVVPKEFIKDPQKLGIQFTLSGTLMQDSTTARMTHTVFEMLQYASNILTLQPGDIISTGSPAGVGSARNPPIFMKAGDEAVCTIEGVGTLRNPVAATEAAR